MDVSSRPGPSGPAANWICLLRGVGGRTVTLRIGRRRFRLSSDTIFFLEETCTEAPRTDSESMFTYVCGTPEALANTLQELRRLSPGEPGIVVDGGGFQAVAN